MVWGIMSTQRDAIFWNKSTDYVWCYLRTMSYNRYVFHFVEFGTLRYVNMLIYHMIDTYSEFQFFFT